MVKYFENINARTFHGEQINGFSAEMVENLQKIYSEYKEGMMKIDQTYQKLFVTGFFVDLKFLFDVKINETLGLPVILPLDYHDIPSKMKLFF